MASLLMAHPYEDKIMILHSNSIIKLLLLFIVCLTSFAAEITKVEHENLLMQVEQQHKHARQQQYAWRDTGKKINKAKKLAAQSEFTQANELLHQALQECEIAKKQSESQSQLSKLLPYYLN